MSGALNFREIPGRLIRLGQEFDFIMAIPENVSGDEKKRFLRTIKSEILSSENIAYILQKRNVVREIHRKLALGWKE